MANAWLMSFYSFTSFEANLASSLRTLFLFHCLHLFLQKVNKPAALIIGVGAMFVFGMNAATHPGGGSVIEQEVKNIKETPTTWSG